VNRQGLSAISAEEPPYPADLTELVEQHLASLRFSHRERTAGLEEAMRYSLLAGGKRIRPVLALATVRGLGLRPEDFLDAAASLELVHTYSLIHDDLPAMDDDDLRRGMPTAHIRYGEDIAILAGDGLFAEAIRLLASFQGPPERVLAALRELAIATGVEGMVGGQYVDVSQVKLNADGLDELHSLKTGRLIEASVGIALELAGVGAGEAQPYRRFAAELGMLFQIVDDILDVVGDEEAIGKPKGSDAKHGKVTYVSLFGVEQARVLASESYERTLAALAEAAPKSGDLAEIAGFIFKRRR
jgi:geranylgeranyl diphosphate synthase type II